MRIYLGQLQRGAFVIRRRSAAWTPLNPPNSSLRLCIDCPSPPRLTYLLLLSPLVCTFSMSRLQGSRSSLQFPLANDFDKRKMERTTLHFSPMSFNVLWAGPTSRCDYYWFVPYAVVLSFCSTKASALSSSSNPYSRRCSALLQQIKFSPAVFVTFPPAVWLCT